MLNHKTNGSHNNGAYGNESSSSRSGSNGSQSALDALFWRDEILQVIYWMRGEELGEAVRAQDLQVFLAADLKTIQFHLEQAVVDGYLKKRPDTATMTDAIAHAVRYSLTDMGRKEGGRRFRDEFAGMQKSGHGECSADCICHTTGDHAHCPTHGHLHA